MRRKYFTEDYIDFRICPQCGKQIKYKHGILKWEAEQMYKDGKLCRSCISASAMKGKTVYEVWLEKYGKEIADQKLQQMKKKQSKNSKGENNPNYQNKCNGARGLIKYSQNCKGKTLEELYGEEKAELIKEKISYHSKGENNPMYGKPTPKRSGNGWSGHYNGYYFRSFLELKYLIYLIENNINFEMGENKFLKIEYEMDNKKRNYFPDFYLIDTKEVIEIKPKNLINSYQNKIKFEAARLKYNDKFIILTEDNIQNINLEILYQDFINEILVFDENYIEKFKKYYEQNRLKG